MYLISRGTLKKKKALVESGAKSSVCSFSVCLSSFRKDLNQLRGEFMPNNSLIFFCVLKNKTHKKTLNLNKQWVAYRACIQYSYKNYALYSTSMKSLTWSVMLFRATPPQKSKFCTPQ